MALQEGAKSCGLIETEEQNGKCSFVVTVSNNGQIDISPHGERNSESEQKRICSGICSSKVKAKDTNKRRISITLLKDKVNAAEDTEKEELEVISIDALHDTAGQPHFVKIYNKDLHSKPSFVVLEDVLVRRRIAEKQTIQTVQCHVQQQTTPCEVGAHTGSQTDDINRPVPNMRECSVSRQKSGGKKQPTAPHVGFSYVPIPVASTCSSCACSQQHYFLPNPLMQPDQCACSNCSLLKPPAATSCNCSCFRPAATLQQQPHLYASPIQPYPSAPWYPHGQCLYYPVSALNLAPGCGLPHCGSCCRQADQHPQVHGAACCNNCNQQQQPQQSRAQRVKLPKTAASAADPLASRPAAQKSVLQQDTTPEKFPNRSSAGAISGLDHKTNHSSLYMARFGRTCLILRPTTHTQMPRLPTKRISRYTSVTAWPGVDKTKFEAAGK